MTAADKMIESLHESLSKDALHEPWTSSIVTLPVPAKTLFYEREDGTSREQAEDLSNACQPATFGLNNQDVLDKTYRRAGKLDAGKFAWLFNPSDYPDFETKLASGLFPWNSSTRAFVSNSTSSMSMVLSSFTMLLTLTDSLQPGKGSFFKAHQDTPRDANMFGSLVVLLPFDHTGGELILRHRGRESTFNDRTLLENAATVSAAYVAFFSDVEHEVCEVTSGHRVTITYNLYFDSTKGAPVTQYISDLEHPFQAELRKIKEGTKNVVLGFGLEHAYPFRSAMVEQGSSHLKGSDATLVKILTDLNIIHYVMLLYREDKTNTRCPFRLLSTNIVNGDQNYEEEESTFTKLTKEGKSWLVWGNQAKSKGTKRPRFTSEWYDEWIDGGKNIPPLKVDWVTEPSEEYVDESISVAYGNEPSLGFYYHQLCVIAMVFDDNAEETERQVDEAEGNRGGGGKDGEREGEGEGEGEREGKDEEVERESEDSDHMEVEGSGGDEEGGHRKHSVAEMRATSARNSSLLAALNQRLLNEQSYPM